MKAFIPPGWVAQEALRLELYRRISIGGDHDALGDDPRPRPSTGTARSPPGGDVVRGRGAPVTAGDSACGRSRRSRSRSGISPVALADAAAGRPGGPRAGREVPRGQADVEPGPERVFGVDLVRWVERAPGAARGRGWLEPSRVDSGRCARLPFGAAASVAARGLALLASCASAEAPRAWAGPRRRRDVASAAQVFSAVSQVNRLPCGSTEGEGETAEAACNRFALGDADRLLGRAGVRGGE